MGAYYKSDKKKSDNRKLDIRNKIIKAAQVYSEELAGKYYIYIYEGKYIEILFKTHNFGHLTGVISPLSGKDFYKKSKNSQLHVGQFSFKDKQADLAIKKTNKLDKLPELTKNDAFIIEDMSSGSRIYKIGMTNLDFSLGVIENRDSKTNQIIDKFLIPTTFRIRGEKDFNNNPNVYQIDLILMKDNLIKKYDTVCFGNINNVELGEEIRQLINEDLLNK